MSMFGDNEIEIVDAQKAAQGAEVKPTVAVEEESKDSEEEEEKEEEEPGSKSNDPVRLYLRKMGSVSLLTREGEVEIAKRIEDGEEVLRSLLACRLAMADILDIGNRLKAGKLRMREVIKDAPRRPRARAPRSRPTRSGKRRAATRPERAEQDRADLQADRAHPQVRETATRWRRSSTPKKITEVKKKEIRQEVRDLRAR